ncbi:MAG TPA: Gfo/Idh/MocA family protein [Candidatus Brocadiaceae bacterium]|nr:Gfo/Idh/MocA family oxidoreductase [Candidatus Woesearchaeota archaeon]
MDYTTQTLGIKIKKVLRYMRLFGVNRTLIKIYGQYHMKKKYECLPALKIPRSGRNVGIIGCGNFAFTNIAYYLNKNYGKVIHAAADINIHAAASLYEKYDLNYYTDDANKLINDPAIDLLYIASNHASHAEYAIKALNVGKSVHIEKPHVVSEDQLIRLCQAMAVSSGRVNIGFNRTRSRFGREIRKALGSQTGTGMYNWFVAGHEIPSDHWYYAKEEGGRVLGNLCHWTDFIYSLVDSRSRYPLTITPVRAVKPDCGIAVNYKFGDGSIAVITFSAGPTFEGVRERLSAQRGNILISMDNFKTLIIEEMDKKIKLSNFFNDHGHEHNIMAGYSLLSSNQGYSAEYVWETAQLFLRTKEALEENMVTVLSGYDSLITSKPY